MIRTISLSVSRIPSTAQQSHITDGIFNALCDDAIPTAELLAVFVHVIPQDARLHAGGDLRHTAGLGTIADNTRNDGQCIDKGWGDRFQVCALQIGNAAARSTARADGPQ